MPFTLFCLSSHYAVSSFVQTYYAKYLFSWKDSRVSPGYTYIATVWKCYMSQWTFDSVHYTFGGLGGLVHSTKSEIRSQAIDPFKIIL